MQIRIKKLFSKLLQIIFPLVLGGAILVWMYHDFNFNRVVEVFKHGMNYWWIFLSLVFGVLSHVFRGMRWKLTLAPLKEYPSTSNCINSVFVSYAANLIIPRIGEVSRCGILAKYNNTSFSKSLGTVVTERLIDSICVMLLGCVVILLEASAFEKFFDKTGTNADVVSHIFSSANFYIILISALSIVVLMVILIRRVSVFAKIRGIFHNIWIGMISLKKIDNFPLFIIYTLAIWACYYFQFYVSFLSFGFSYNLGMMAGLVMFVLGSVAVVVPTPNGAGPWHFAIITMMMLYGVGKEDAGIFALIVHAIQTFLLILLGIYGMVALPLTNKKNN